MIPKYKKFSQMIPKGENFHLMKFQDNSEDEDQSREIPHVKMNPKYRKFTQDNSSSWAKEFDRCC
jgi:hypothetical protein